MSQNNLHRFGLHLAFAGATWIAVNAASLDLDATTTTLIIALATAAASFFRGRGAAK